ERAFRTSYDSEGWRKTSCYPGVAALLHALHEDGFRLWVATNKPQLAAARILRRFEIDWYFEEVACRDSRTPAYESKAHLLAGLVERNGLSPASCLMVGDTHEDAAAACAAGMACAIVAHGYGCQREPGDPGCKWISNWEELLEYCKSPERKRSELREAHAGERERELVTER